MNLHLTWTDLEGYRGSLVPMLEVRQGLRQGVGYGVEPERQEQMQTLGADVQA